MVTPEKVHPYWGAEKWNGSGPSDTLYEDVMKPAHDGEPARLPADGTLSSLTSVKRPSRQSSAVTMADSVYPGLPLDEPVIPTAVPRSPATFARLRNRVSM